MAGVRTAPGMLTCETSACARALFEIRLLRHAVAHPTEFCRVLTATFSPLHAAANERSVFFWIFTVSWAFCRPGTPFFEAGLSRTCRSVK
ncbi:MAG: hypothetical protein JWN34_5789 [Bryobacterales bacterium]|nr:hypothetical protein [Bryobacterales bacterium]